MTFQVLPAVLAIQVQNGHEHGVFYVRQGINKQGDNTYYWCELTVNSTFGTVSHHWASMGCPAHEFLARDRAYIRNKLWGDQARIFDAATAIESLKTTLLDRRRNNQPSRRYTKDAVREAYDEIKDCCVSDYHEWVSIVQNQDLLYHIACEGDVQDKIVNPACVKFFELLWPEFIEGLKQHYFERHCKLCDGKKATVLGQQDEHVGGCPNYDGIPF